MEMIHFPLAFSVLFSLGVQTSPAQNVQEIPKGGNRIYYAFCGSFDIPARSRGNHLIITVSNPVDQNRIPLEMDSVMVWITWPRQQSFPGWPAPSMVITPESQTVPYPAPGEKTQAKFTFDGGTKVQPGDSDSLRIAVVGRTGPLLNKVAAIHFVGTEQTTRASKSQSVTITIE